MRVDIRRGAVLLVAASSLLAGCSSSDGGDKGSGTQGTKASTQGAAPGTPSAVPSMGGGASASGTPVASATVSTPEHPGGKLEIAIMSLQVRGKLAILTIRLTPHLPLGSDEKTNPYELNDQVPVDSELIDTVNLKRYVVVKDNQGQEVKSDDVRTPIHNEQPGIATYAFAAPPGNVQALDVHYGHWPTFPDVPVQR